MFEREFDGERLARGVLKHILQDVGRKERWVRRANGWGVQCTNIIHLTHAIARPTAANLQRLSSEGVECLRHRPTPS